MVDNIDDAVSKLDLGVVLNDLQENKPAPTPQPPKSDEPLDLGQFKNPKDLLKSYKEIQAAFTKVTQENKAAKEQLAQMQEQIELSRYNAPPMQEPQFQQQQQYSDPDIALQQTIQRSVATQRIAEVLEEEAEANRAEFQERYAYAQMVSKEYPQLSQSARGVKKLFQLGDKLRQENLRKNAGKALEAVFGEPLTEEETNKLRQLVKGDKGIIKPQTNINNAYMPDTSTSTRTGSDLTKTSDAESEMQDAVKKGDVDGTIDALFKGILAE